jgi:heme/copper-type cytochrome/quinol oxidase subunit 3
MENTINNINNFKFKRYHWFNMVTVSPWPLLLSINALPALIGFVGFMHGFTFGLELLIFCFVTFLILLSLWFRDIIRESTFYCLHTKQVEQNTITGFKLFLFTETMLFVTFFWSHLYAALFPSPFIGLAWPPVGMHDLIIDPYGIPLINTAILVYSGFTITLSHLYLRKGSQLKSCIVMAFTILLGLFFLYFQYEEFTSSDFDISDGIYGSTFFMLTGFHGGHVLIGVTFLIVTLVRTFKVHFSSSSHTGFKLALIYWHFVDIIWIFVYIIIYVLGSDFTSQNFIYYFNNEELGSNAGFLLSLDNAFFGHYDDLNILSIMNNFRESWIDFVVFTFYNTLTCEKLDMREFYPIGTSTKWKWCGESWVVFSQDNDIAQLYFIYDHVVNDRNVLSKNVSDLLMSELALISWNQYDMYFTRNIRNVLNETNSEAEVVRELQQFFFPYLTAHESYYLTIYLPELMNSTNSDKCDIFVERCNVIDTISNTITKFGSEEVSYFQERFYALKLQRNFSFDDLAIADKYDIGATKFIKKLYMNEYK